MAQGTGVSIDQLLALKGVGAGDTPQWGTETPGWSPDGTQIVFPSLLAGALELWSVAPGGGAPTRLTAGMGGVGHLASTMPKWSPAGGRIAYVSAKSGADEVWLWDADGAPDRQLTRLGARIEAMSWAPDGKSLAVASNSAGTFDIFRVAVADGAAVRLTQDPRYEVYPSFLPDGRILYVRLNEPWTAHDVILMNGDGTGPRVVLQDTDFFDYHYGKSFNYPKVSPDGRTFLFRSHRSGWVNVWAAPTTGGDAWQIAPADADQGDAVWSPDGRSIAYTENHNGTLDLRIVSSEGGAPRVVVAPSMGVCAGAAWSPDGTQVSFLCGTPTAPFDLWIVPAAGGTARRLTQSMLGGGVERRLAPPEKIAYPSGGRTINAYLYRPAASAAPSPGIVWIHGGPTSQFLDTFQPSVQYFVGCGYTVLLPNIRGSSGYGREFEDLNNADWGHGDLDDAIAGAAYLRGLAGVDAGHIGITGTSYGGILSMAAVAYAPAGVFQAAIPCSGYADFAHMYGEQELRHVKLLEYEFGTLAEHPDVYRRCSPLYSAHEAATPCFVIHGEGRYPGSDAARNFALALEAHYKPFWYKAYPGETYYVTGRENTKQMLRDMRDFFDLYLRAIPHNRADDGTRPLTHLSGVRP